MFKIIQYYADLKNDIKAIQIRLDVLEGKRKKEIDELFNPENNTDPDFNRVNVNYTRDDEREYELREKWQKEHKLTADEEQEWNRINEKYGFTTKGVVENIVDRKNDIKKRFDKEFTESVKRNPDMSDIERTRRVNEWLNYQDNKEK